MNINRHLEISAVIPAYNEAKNILWVLTPLRQVPDVREIIVVSDGSTDGTDEIVKQFGGARVISLPKNVGKTKAALQGVLEARYPTLMFCDADLINLNKYHFIDLIARYREGFDMIIMDKGSQPWVFRNLLKSAPAVSGTRILDKQHFFEIPFLDTDRFQFEIRINDYFLEKELRIAISPADEVRDSRKYVKYPFFKGLVLDLKGGLEVLASDGPPSIVKNLAAFRKIKELAYAPNPSKRTRKAMEAG